MLSYSSEEYRIGRARKGKEGSSRASVACVPVLGLFSLGDVVLVDQTRATRARTDDDGKLAVDVWPRNHVGDCESETLSAEVVRDRVLAADVVGGNQCRDSD